MRIAGWRYPVVVDLAGLAIPSQSRPDPLRPRHAKRRGPHRRDPRRGRASSGRRRGLARHGRRPGDRRLGKQRLPLAGLDRGVGRAVRVRQGAARRCWSTAGEFTGPLNVVRKATLGEISFVDLGADGQTSRQRGGQAESDPETPPEEKTPMETSHVAPTSATSPQPAATPATTPAPAVAPTPAPVAAHAASPPPAPRDRADRCGDPCPGRGRDPADRRDPQDLRRAVHPRSRPRPSARAGTVDRCALEVLRASRPKAPAVHVRRQLLSPARSSRRPACSRPGCPASTSCSTPQTVDRPPGGSAAASACRSCCWRPPGPTATRPQLPRQPQRAAVRLPAPSSRPGFSTIDIGGILSNVANKFLLEGFFSVERTWRNICRRRATSPTSRRSPATG